MNDVPLAPVHFLLVDDLEENLLSLDALLRRKGLVLLKARSGMEALELLLKHEVALALLDIQMPGMNGFELAELMRGTDRTRRIPIIFLTAGNADRQRRFRGYETGAVDFLQKPIEPDILRSKAEVFFELYRQQQLLAHQRDKLQEADRRKDEFLATLAHELRNPLAPIRNGLQILQTVPNGEHSSQIRDMMDRQLTHLVRLIDDLLDVSRVSQGKISLRKERITVQDIIRSAVETSRPLITDSKHELTLNIPNEALWVFADLTRLAQVVSNLLNNAAKYTPEGGRIDLTVHKEEKDVLVSVTDNGSGIPADMLPRVFELFTQVDRNLDRSQGGLGIGLALVKRLVEMHGGTIRAQSEGLGKGSTFTVRWPLLTQVNLQEPVDEVKQPGIDPTSPVTPLSVLIVDDNVDSARTLGWMLELIGHQPTLRHDGLAALDAAIALRPDVILLDIGLPGMSGYDVCRELRKDPRFKNTLIIAQTGWGQERDLQSALDAGFDHHLLKPVNVENISKLLANKKNI